MLSGNNDISTLGSKLTQAMDVALQLLNNASQLSIADLSANIPAEFTPSAEQMAAFPARQKKQTESWTAIWGKPLSKAILLKSSPQAFIAYSNKLAFHSVQNEEPLFSVENPENAIILVKELCGTPQAITNVLKNTNAEEQRIFIEKMGIDFFKQTIKNISDLKNVLIALKKENQTILINTLDAEYCAGLVKAPNDLASLANLIKEFKINLSNLDTICRKIILTVTQLAQTLSISSAEFTTYLLTNENLNFVSHLLSTPETFLDLLRACDAKQRLRVLVTLFNNISFKKAMLSKEGLAEEIQDLFPLEDTAAKIALLHPSLENDFKKIRSEFVKIYRALYAGQTSFFKGKDWVETNNIENSHTDTDFKIVRLIAKHAWRKNSRTAEAWRILTKYGVVNVENHPALNSIYKYGFAHSGLFKSGTNLIKHPEQDVFASEAPANSRRERILSVMR